MIKKRSSGVVPKVKNQRGYLLVLVMVTSVALMAIAVAIMSVSSSKYAKTSTDGKTANAVYVAEAGVSDTLNRLNQSNTFTGYSTKKQFYSSNEKGKADYTTTVAAGANDTLIVTSTGNIYTTPDSTSPVVTRTIKAILTKARTPITENVIAGAAGLTMSGTYFPWFGQPTAMQKGSVYSRGKIRLNGGATSIGTAADSARVNTPNVGCGPAANFPQQCAANDPPITFGGTWFSSGVGKIYGSVCATDQPASADILPGPTGTGLQQGCIAPDYGMPYFDKEEFTNSKVVPILAPVAQCTIPFFGPILPVIWPANARIVGNVNLAGNFLGDCAATLMGDVYIKGDLTIGSKARINVSDTLGGRKPVIVVNGKVTIKNDATGVFANSSNSPVTIVSFWSTDNDCSTSDTCTTLNPAHLYSTSMQGLGSAWYTGGNRAVTFENTGFGGSSTPNISGLATYSYFGSTLYSFSNNASMRGIGGQEVVINPGGAFSFSGGSLSVTDTSPFAHVLSRTKYVVGDYLQVF